MRAHSLPHPPRAVRRLAGAALTVAVVGITTTTAYAASDAGNIAVEPSPARPGSTVTLSTDACGPGGSAGVDTSSLGGGILGLESQNTKAKTALGKLRIPAGTKHGNYAVGGSCTDGQELIGTVVVGEGERKAEDPAPAEDEGKGEAPDDGDRGARHRAAEPETHHGKGAAGDHRDAKAPHHGTGDGWVQGQREWAEKHDDRHDGHDRHGKMPRGRVHTGVGGGSEGMATGRLAGGSAALAAAAGGVLYLRRRHRSTGS